MKVKKRLLGRGGVGSSTTGEKEAPWQKAKRGRGKGERKNLAKVLAPNF